MQCAQSGEWKVRLDVRLARKEDSWPFSMDPNNVSREGSFANPQADALRRGAVRASRAAPPSSICDTLYVNLRLCTSSEENMIEERNKHMCVACDH